MKKIMLLVFLLLLVVPLVSAAGWDNGLKYEQEDLKVVLENGYFFGVGDWFGFNEEIGTAELKSHSSVNEVKEVGGGDQVVMWYDFDFKGEYKNGLGKVYFTDEKTGKEMDRDYSFVYWGEETREQVYCVESGVNPTDCNKYGMETITREKWLPYNSIDIPEGKIRIGLMTYVEIDDHIDGVWTIAGKKVKKHSEWTAALNVGLVRYFKLDDQTGTVATDSTGTSDGGIVGGVVKITGKIGFAANSSETFEYVYSNINSAVDTWTVATWFNMPLPSDQNIVSSGNIEVYIKANGTVGGEASAAFWGNQTFTVADWNLIITQSDDSSDTTVQWVDNVLSYKTVGVINPFAGSNWTFPRTNDKVKDVSYDEIGIWNRTLSDAEIDQLWNGGTGITHTTDFPAAPVVTLDAPADSAVVTNPSVVFNATGKDDVDLENMSLIVNGSRVSTNTSVFNNTLTQFPYTLTSDGFWNWTVEGCDDGGRCVNATLRVITYSNDLAITLNDPANATTIQNPNVVFNATGKDDTTLQNMSLIVNGSYISTNTSVFNNTLTQFPHTLPSASFYNWTVEACDNLGECVNATAREFTYTNELTITLNLPNNDDNFYLLTNNFNCTPSDDTSVTNTTLIINGTEQTATSNSSVFNDTLTNFQYTADTIGFFNWSCIAYDSSDSVTATYRNFTISSDISSTLNEPVNAFNSSSQSIIFNATGKDDTTLQNMSLIINESYITTNSSVFNNTKTQFPRTLADGFYNWTVEACDDIGVCINATTRNVSVDSVLPAINITSPFPNGTTINLHNSSTNQTLNWTATDDSLDSCWIAYNFTNRTVTCDVNTSSFTLTYQRNATFWANDTFGNENSSIIFWNYLVLQHLSTFNASSFETESETFYINISTNGTIPSAAKLIYNGTTHTATVTNIVGDDYNISGTIDIPIIPETKPFHWNITVGGTEIQTLATSQIINLTNFTHFTTGIPFVNISFVNETLAQELVNSTIDSDWYYWLGGGDVVKTHSFTNASENAYYPFLLVGVNRTLNTNVSLTYSNSISQQRNYANADLELTNATTNLSLYLLPTSDGIYVTFQVINLAQQPLAGVSSNATRSGTLISSGTTDDAGSITYFLDPDTNYQFYFALSGYSTYTTTFAPSQTTYTITMSVTAAGVTEDYTRGINYSFSPGIETLTNNTLTFFNFSLTSSYWTVSDYGFNLTNQDGTRVNASNESADGGTVYVYHNTSDDTSLTMTYYWIVTGNLTSGSFAWVVFDGTGTGFGIKTFTDRTTTYLSEGIFGINANSMVILIYLIIFVSVGIMSLKFGIRSPATITMVLFGLSFLFEIHLGLIPSVGGVPLLTTVIGIIVAISIIREQLKI